MQALAEAGVLGGWSHPDSPAELRAALELNAPKKAGAPEPIASQQETVALNGSPDKTTDDAATSKAPAQPSVGAAQTLAPSGETKGADLAARDAELDRALDRRVPIQLEGANLDELAFHVRQITGLDVSIDRPSLEEDGVGGAELTFSADLSRATVAEALDLVFRGQEVDWTAQAGGLVFASRAAIEELTEVRVYDVTDIVAADADEATSSVSELMELVTVASDSTWFEIDGTGGEMRPLKARGRQLLAVSQTGRAHYRIRQLLRAVQTAAFLREQTPNGPQTGTPE